MIQIIISKYSSLDIFEHFFGVVTPYHVKGYQMHMFSCVHFVHNFSNVKLFVGDKTVDQMDDSASHRQDTLAMHKLELDLSPSAIAGLVEPEAQLFEDYRDSRLKCVPVSHAWTPAGDLLIGCEQGQLLKVCILCKLSF